MNKTVKVYGYEGCSSCKKAYSFLNKHAIPFEKQPIRESPPNRDELSTMLGVYDGNIRKLFNTSGRDYQSMNLKEKLPTLTTSQAFDLLTQNGNLVKRPFMLKGSEGLVGFNEARWTSFFKG